MWLSIMPPCVGSGCRQMSVAAGGRFSGRASSPTSFRPSEVTRVISSRRAGSTVLAVISVIGSSPVRLETRARSPGSSLPAGVVPVSPVLRPRRVGWPDHNVRGAHHELLVAAGTAVRLRRGGARYLTHDPVAIRPLLQPRRAEPDSVGTRWHGFRSWPAGSPGLARRVRRQPARLPWAHVYSQRASAASAGMSAGTAALAGPPDAGCRVLGQ